jgi:hypothetical protein
MAEAEREAQRQEELAGMTAEALRASLETAKPYDPLSPPDSMVDVLGVRR